MSRSMTDSNFGFDENNSRKRINNWVKSDSRKIDFHEPEYEEEYEADTRHYKCSVKDDFYKRRPNH